VIWILYNILFAIGFTLILPKFLVRMWKRGGYRKGFLQRLGSFPPDMRAAIESRPRVWIHAVSVGELYVALRLLKDLRTALPGVGYVVSTNTSTAHQIALQRLDKDDVLIYFPVDFPWVVRRVLRILKPKAVLLMESELWPNLVRLASSRGIPVAIVNGRVSDRSYPRYRQLRMFFGPILRHVDLLLMQSREDARRQIEVGARAETVCALGSVKYDVAVADASAPEDAAPVIAASGMRGSGPVIVGGSTWPGEEAALLDAFVELRAKHAGLRLVLVPRHAERRAEVEAEARKRNLALVKRSEMAAPGWQAPAQCDALLVDTTGELKKFYRSADVVFVGKSLTARGGQNLIEPAILGKAIVIGPHMENFRDVTADFAKSGAVVQVSDAPALTAALDRLLAEAALRADYGRRAAEVVASHCGVVAESVRRLVELINRK
jgi:3-deoxy-D-manno-octulosonic-acid transferase